MAKSIWASAVFGPVVNDPKRPKPRKTMTLTRR